MTARTMCILGGGLETCVQELPGRIGFLGQGFPVSGPFDKWSFRLANLLVGNDRDAAALECQFLGPRIQFNADATVALTGADMRATLDGAPVAMWESVDVRRGQVLALSGAIRGARAYLAVDGGVQTEPVLGSRAVFHMAGVGGRSLREGDELTLGPLGPSQRRMSVAPEHRPVFSDDRVWSVEAMLGPNDDWLAPESVEMFFSTPWKVLAQSSRTGMRLEGKPFRFAGRALTKNADHGQDPSNILDHGYPPGAINLAGQMPIILVSDSPSTGGFINPFTVASAAFWKLAQARPGEHLHFRCVDADGAAGLRASLEANTREAVLKAI